MQEATAKEELFFVIFISKKLIIFLFNVLKTEVK